MFIAPQDSIEAFDRLQNKFLGNFNMERKPLKSFKVCLAFPDK